MPREQDERRPSKPDLPRVEAGDAERLATRFNAIHTRWQGESPSKSAPAAPSPVPRHEPLPDRTSVHVSPILKIDGATPPMPSGLTLAQSLEPPVSDAERRDGDASPVAGAAGATAIESSDDDGWGASPVDPGVPDDSALAAAEPAAPATDDALAGERPSPTPPLATSESGATATATALQEAAPARVPVAPAAAHELQSDEAAPPHSRASRWRWLLAALTVAVAGVSLYRTLYVVESPRVDAASVIPAAAPPPVVAAPPAASSPLPAMPTATASAPTAALADQAPAAATSAKSQATPQRDVGARKAKLGTPPPPKAKAPARKAAAAAGGDKTGAAKVSAGAAKQSVKQTAPERRKLSAKPRKPPPKKERTGIIRKSPF